MSLPPAKWSAQASLQHTLLGRAHRPLRNLLLATAWSSRNPHARERFRTELNDSARVPIWYTTADGWQAPLLHLPAAPGGSCEPVVLAPGLGFNEKTLDANTDRSLARFLQAAGFDVFILTHRASRLAVPPPHQQGFNFDDIVVSLPLCRFVSALSY